MTEQVTPKEYHWIKPGTFGIKESLPGRIEFLSTPYFGESVSVGIADGWLADTNFGPLKVDGFTQFFPDTAILEYAREILDEHADAVKDAVLMSRSYPNKQDEEMHIYHALAEISSAIRDSK